MKNRNIALVIVVFLSFLTIANALPDVLSISTSPSTPLRNYLVTLTGSANGVVRQSSAALVVQAEQSPFDFALSASPTQQSTKPGGSATYSITVSLVSGASQSVELSVSTPPTSDNDDDPTAISTAISAPTSVNSGSGAPSFKSILSILTDDSIPGGQYMITVTGTAGSIMHSVTVTLTVVYGIDGNSPSQTVSITSSQTVSITDPLQIQSQTQSQATSQSGPVSTGGLLETLQQNSLILIAALVLLVILSGVLAMRGRGKQTAPSTH